MEFNRGKSPTDGKSPAAHCVVPQLKGGCKASLVSRTGANPYSNRRNAMAYLNKFSRNNNARINNNNSRNRNNNSMHSAGTAPATVTLAISPGIAANNENCRPKSAVNTNIPRVADTTRAGIIMSHAMLNKANVKNKTMDRVLSMGSPKTPLSPNNSTHNNSVSSLFTERSPSSSILSSTRKTYSRKKSEPNSVLNSSTYFRSKSSPVTPSNQVSVTKTPSPITSLAMNSSVTLTPIPTPGTSATKRTPTYPVSLRKLDFGMQSKVKSHDDPFSADSDVICLNTFPMKSTSPILKRNRRQPLTPIRSTILGDISPARVEKAYGPDSAATSEKENVPVIPAPAEDIPTAPHLLGFPNLGNTCYLNAVLQSLVGLRMFRCDVSSSARQLQLPTTTLLHALTQLLAARRRTTAAAAAAVVAATTATPTEIALVNVKQPLRLIKENFERLDSSFIGWKMQDANEFLTKVLDTIKDEVDQSLEKIEECSSRTIKENAMTPPKSSALEMLDKLSPFKKNVPKLWYNSVVICTIPSSEIKEQKNACNGCEDSPPVALSNRDSNDKTCTTPNCNTSDSDMRRGVKRTLYDEVEDNTNNGEKVWKFKSLNNNQVTSCSKLSSDSSSDIQRKCLPSSAKKDLFNNNTNEAHNNTHINGTSGNKNINISNPITDNFGFQLHEYYKCLGCKETVKRGQEYFSLYVHLSASAEDATDGNGVEAGATTVAAGPRSIREAVADYMKEEQRELKCEACGHTQATVTTRFTKMPRILIIQVKRYKFNTEQYSSLKVCSSIEVNKSLDLAPFSSDDFLPYPAVAAPALVSAPPTPSKTLELPIKPNVRFAEYSDELPTLTNGGDVSDGGSSNNVVSSSSNSDSRADAEDKATEQATEPEKTLSEDEQLQEALRRSLDDAAVSGAQRQQSGGGEEEEDDLQKAIRLSLEEQQQREEQEQECLRKTQELEAEQAHSTMSPKHTEQNQESSGSSTSSEAAEQATTVEEDCTGPHCYRLASIVSHFGRNTTAGHYVCDVLSEACADWLHYDDETVTVIPQAAVLGEARQRNGYIFFYVHRDLLNSPAC